MNSSIICRKNFHGVIFKPSILINGYPCVTLKNLLTVLFNQQSSLLQEATYQQLLKQPKAYTILPINLNLLGP